MLKVFALLSISVVAAGCTASATLPVPSGYVSEFKSDWYADQLEALGQRKPLYKQVGPNEQGYRFTWLRTFHAPLCFVLIVQRGGNGFLRFAEASGAGGYEPGSIVATASRRVPVEEVQGFLAALESADFWNMSSEDSSVRIGPDGEELLTITVDGAQWILEGVRNSSYHLVDRNSPEGPYRDALLKLVALSRRFIDPVY